MTTARQVLEKVNQIYSINPKLGESLQKAAAIIEKSSPGEGSASPPPPSPSKPAEPPVHQSLKGLNPKLLEKIRAKVIYFFTFCYAKYLIFSHSVMQNISLESKI